MTLKEKVAHIKDALHLGHHHHHHHDGDQTVLKNDPIESNPPLDQLTPVYDAPRSSEVTSTSSVAGSSDLEFERKELEAKRDLNLEPGLPSTRIPTKGEKDPETAARPPLSTALPSRSATDAPYPPQQQSGLGDRLHEGAKEAKEGVLEAKEGMMAAMHGDQSLQHEHPIAGADLSGEGASGNHHKHHHHHSRTMNINPTNVSKDVQLTDAPTFPSTIATATDAAVARAVDVVMPEKKLEVTVEAETRREGEERVVFRDEKVRTEIRTEIQAPMGVPVEAVTTEIGSEIGCDGKTTDVVELGKEPVVKIIKMEPTVDRELHFSEEQAKHVVEVKDKHVHHEHFIKPPPVKEVKIQEHHHYHTEVLPPDQHDVVIEEHHHHHERLLPAEVIKEHRDIHIDHIEKVKPATVVTERVEQFESKDKTLATREEAEVIEARGEEFMEQTEQGTRDLKEISNVPREVVEVLPPTKDVETHAKVDAEAQHTVEKQEKHFHHDHFIKPAPVKEVEVQEHHHYHQEVLPPDEHEVVVREHHHHHQKLLPEDVVVEKRDVHIDHVREVKPDTIVREQHKEVEHRDIKKIDVEGNVADVNTADLKPQAQAA